MKRSFIPKPKVLQFTFLPVVLFISMFGDISCKDFEPQPISSDNLLIVGSFMQELFSVYQTIKHCVEGNLHLVQHLSLEFWWDAEFLMASSSMRTSWKCFEGFIFLCFRHHQQRLLGFNKSRKRKDLHVSADISKVVQQKPTEQNQN